MQIVSKLNPLNRSSDQRSNCLAGFVFGILAFGCAMLLLPQNIASPGDHDQALAIRLGFVYAPITLLWFRNAESRIPLGIPGTIIVGLLIGAVYAWLCTWYRNFFLIMVIYPIQFAWLLNISSRIARDQKLFSLATLKCCNDGILAGLAAGAVYAAVLNIGAIGLYLSQLIDDVPTVQTHSRAMLYGGTGSFALASTFFYYLIGKSQASLSAIDRAKEIRTFSVLMSILLIAVIYSALKVFCR